jgi:hypothetical protein
MIDRCNTMLDASPPFPVVVESISGDDIVVVWPPSILHLLGESETS